MSNSEPPERNVKDFEFLQLSKFRIAPPGNEIPIQRGKLLACSSQYGLLIYVTGQGLAVVKTSLLQALDEKQGKARNKVIIQDVPVEVKIDLTMPVLFMDVSGDGNYLAVAVRDRNQLVILFYDIRAFADKTAGPNPFARSPVTSSPNAVLLDLSWNPANPTMLAVCTSDGKVELLDITENPKVIASLAPATGATCFCWSPKGKQLLVGKEDGSLSQYDHHLIEKKKWPFPDVGKTSGPHKVVDVVWQSTHIFLAAYLPSGAGPSEQPTVILTLGTKDKKSSYINFEDACFGTGEERKAQYIFHLVQKWDLILMASSNATETTIVAKHLDDQTSWEHWILEDSCRAELPLTENQNDSFPLGLAVDYSPQNPIVLSENQQLPPCPIMYLLSTDGLLMAFHLSYSHKDAVSITSPAHILSATGARKRVREEYSHSAAESPTITSQAHTSTTSSHVFITSPATNVLSTTMGSIFCATSSHQKSQNLISQGPVKTSQNPQNSGSLMLTTPVNSCTTTVAAFSFVAPLVSFPAALDPAKPFSQNQLAGSNFVFGQQTHSTSQSQTPVQQATTAGATSITAKNTVPSFFGSKLVSGITTCGSHAANTVNTAPSAFSSKSVLTGQTVLSPQTTSINLRPTPSVRAGSPGTTSSETGLPKLVPPVSQAAVSLASSAHTLSSVEMLPKSIETTVGNAFTQNIIEEILDFERELHELKMRSQERKIKTVGTKEEMYTLRQDTSNSLKFSQEIKEATKEQLKEVQEEKSLCLSLFVMAEECKSQQERDSDPHYHSILQSQVLDPVSAEKLKNLQHMSQVLEQSVVDVDRVLDAQWEEHLAKKKNEERLHRPTGDIIYKSIKNNHILIASQRQQLEKLEEQLRSLKLYNKSNNQNFSSFPLTLLTEATSRPTMNLQSAVTNGMTPEKVAKLREVLSQRKVPRIKSTIPGQLSMSKIVSQTCSRTPRITGSPEEKQRKHQSPSTTTQFQLPPAMDQLRFRQKGQLQSDGNQPQNSIQQTKGSIISMGEGGQHLAANGVAYFKQLAEPVVTKANDQTVSVSTTVGWLGRNPQASHAQGKVVSSQPDDSASSAPDLPQKSFYENITPTETDETNDEDDEYDEEENGYDDEEEDDDEEETGFMGMNEGVNIMKSTSQPSVTTYMSIAAPKDLFGVKTVSAASDTLEKLSTSSEVVKSGSLGSSFGTSQIGQTTITTSASTVTTTTAATEVSSASGGGGASVFGQKAGIGFTFAGAAVFGQKSGLALNNTGQGPVFGAMATPSKAVGFGELASKEKPGLVTTTENSRSPTSSLQALDTVTCTSGPKTTTSSFTFTLSSTQPSVFGGLKTECSTVSSTLLNGGGTASVFGGKSATEGSRFSFGTTPLASGPAGFSFTPTATVSSITETLTSASTDETVTATTTSSSSFGHTDTMSGENTSTKPADTSNGVPGSPQELTSTTSTTISLFGAPLAAAAKAGVTTSSSVFGAAATSATQSWPGSSTTTLPSVFGSKTATGSSGFGGDGDAPLFGSTTTSSALTDEGFEATTPTSSGVLFGGAGFGATTSGDLFGTSATASSSSTVFGTGSDSSLFGSIPTNNSVFGSGMSTGQQGPVFGQPMTRSSFGFGQPSNTSSVFGPPSSTATSTLFGHPAGSPLFGQASSSSTPFGQSAATSTTSTPFGFGGLGGKPSEEKAKQNVFGVPQVFGVSASQNNNLFGTTGNSTFGSLGTSPFSTNTGGGFSSASGAVASSGFGVSTSPQTSGGFGAAPTFGGTAFGSKVGGFGSNPAFGGAPSFGPSPIFSSSPGLGSPSSTGGFSSFASAAAPSFGQLAQSSASTSAFASGGFGTSQQSQSSLFGSGFGSSQQSFGGSAFGAGFGGGQQQSFGAPPSFGNTTAFSSYRG